MKYLRRLREQNAWSRAELARRAQMSNGTVGQIEAGRFIPYESQLRKLADALGWDGDPAALLEEVGDDASC